METLKRKDSVDATSKKLIRQSQHYRFYAGWGSHLFFQTNDGVLWACGMNKFGQLSLDAETKVFLSPVKVTFFTPGSKKEIQVVSIGAAHSLFLSRSSGAFSAGSNNYYQLSDSTSDYRSLAVPVVLEDEKVKIHSVVAGWHCSYFISVNGEVFSAGMNSNGQLGHIDRKPWHSYSPGGNKINIKRDKSVSVGKKVSAVSEIVQIITGWRWVIFRSKKSNALFGCGRNFGQFGIGNTNNDQPFPVEISYFKERNIKIDFLVSSHHTAYFVTSANQVYCSGDGSSGQFGNEKAENSTVPVLSRPLSGFQIFCSGNTSEFVIMKKNDRFYGCGYEGGGGSGRYGYSDSEAITDAHISLVEIESLRGKNVKQIVTRRFGTYVICGDGSIFATGQEGYSGVMMNGKKEDLNKFTFVGKYKLKRRSEHYGGYRAKQERIIFLMTRHPSIRRLFSFCFI